MSRKSLPDVGSKIKSLRAQQKLTLEQLSNRSGVSKSMLSQIERGRTNPTLATLWSLTQSLGVDIADLLESPSTTKEDEHRLEVSKSHQTPEIQSADGKCVLKILSPLSLVSQTEWYEITMEPQGLIDSDSHGDGTAEHLTVIKGELEITIGSKYLTIGEGDTARYDTDTPHSIRNKGNISAKAFLVVVSSTS